MLSSITLENFKAFKNLDNLEIKPITIFCGTNSCGKSSILESILLLKQTIESKNPNQNLLLNGRFVHLGNFENVIFEKNTDSDLVLNYSFKMKKSDFPKEKNKASFPFLIRDLISRESFDDINSQFIINYKITLGIESKSKIKKYINPIIVKNVFLNVQSENETQISLQSMIEMKFEGDGLYEIIWDNIQPRYSSSKILNKSGDERNIKVTFANLFPYDIIESDELEERKIPYEIANVFHRLNDILQRIVGTFTYLGPLREEPSRRYIYEDEIVEIGVKGENAAYIYSTEQDDILKKHYIYNSENDSFHEEKSIKLSEALEHWFTLMKIEDFRTEQNSEIIFLNLKSGSGEDTRVNIADVGFGVSQIFPILLEGLRMRKGSTLLLEQPEIHLHPNLQMQLADYFISIALSGKNVIVETHSDHIINRLVRRIVEDDTFNLSSLINIFFISSTPSGSIYEKVKIDDKRGIVNWPDGFFDQSATEQERIIRAGLKKRKLNRENRED